MLPSAPTAPVTTKRLLIIGPRIPFPFVLVYALLIVGAVILYQFHSKYIKIDKIVEDSQQFVDTECVYQIARRNMLNNRMSQLIVLDNKLSAAQTSMYNSMVIASIHRADVNDPIAERYWANLALQEERIQQVDQSIALLDQSSYQAMIKVRLPSACNDSVVPPVALHT